MAGVGGRYGYNLAAVAVQSSPGSWFGDFDADYFLSFRCSVVAGGRLCFVLLWRRFFPFYGPINRPAQISHLRRAVRRVTNLYFSFSANRLLAQARQTRVVEVITAESSLTKE